MMQAVARVTDRLLDGVLIACMAGLVLNILWQVASRYLLNDPSSFTEELARFLLIWIALLGACHAYRNGSHLGLDILTGKFPPAVRLLARRLVLLVVMAFAGLALCYGGGNLVWLTLELKQTSAAMGIPMGYVYAALPISGALIIFYSLLFWLETPAATGGR